MYLYKPVCTAGAQNKHTPGMRVASFLQIRPARFSLNPLAAYARVMNNSYAARGVCTHTVMYLPCPYLRSGTSIIFAQDGGDMPAAAAR
jgi:hypothetical protein